MRITAITAALRRALKATYDLDWEKVLSQLHYVEELINYHGDENE